MSKGTVGAFKNFCGKEIMSFIEWPWFFSHWRFPGASAAIRSPSTAGGSQGKNVFSRPIGVFFMRVGKPNKIQKMLTCAKGFVISNAVPQCGTGLFRQTAIHSVPSSICRFGDIRRDPEITIRFPRFSNDRKCRSKCCEERGRGGSRRNLPAAAFSGRGG